MCEDKYKDLRDLSKGNIEKYVTGGLENEIVQKDKLQLRMFLLANAKAELDRVVKLTETMDKLQDIYQEKIFEQIEQRPAQAVYLIPKMMDTISKCLERSNNIIKQVASDDKLLNMLLIDMSTVINNNVNNNEVSNSSSILPSSVSRNKVRDAINIINGLMENKYEEDIIEVSTEESFHDNPSNN